MKTKIATLVAALSLSGCIIAPPNSTTSDGANAGGQPQVALGSNGVSSPIAGVICDQNAGFCADSQGISMAYTEQYLGADAQKNMMSRMQDNFDSTTFVLSDGVACNTQARKCTVAKFSDQVDTAHTRALFGQ